VELDTPGLYQTAANLGTALELSGDLDGAHHWISEGIKRNKDAHNGTEWLHLRILEAKKQMQSDPDWLLHHTISGIQYSSDLQWWGTLDTVQGQLRAAQVASAISYQLEERMSLVKPKDTIVACLISEFIRLKLENIEATDVFELLELADDYGLPQEISTPLHEKLGPAKKFAKADPIPDWMHRWGDLISAVLGIVVLGFVALKVRSFVSQ
jgi:hypothetical protein